MSQQLFSSDEPSQLWAYFYAHTFVFSVSKNNIHILSAIRKFIKFAQAVNTFVVTSAVLSRYRHCFPFPLIHLKERTLSIRVFIFLWHPVDCTKNTSINNGNHIFSFYTMFLSSTYLRGHKKFE